MATLGLLLSLIAVPALPARAAAPAAGAQAAAAATNVSPAAPPPADPRALSYAPLPIAFPKPEKLFLPDGLMVYLFEDHEVPLIDAAFYLRSGSIYDPADKAGLSEVATQLMRTGGTSTLSPDQVDQTLEAMPAQVSLSSDDDALTGSLSTLKTRFPEALAIFAGMLRAPRFDAARLELEKARMVEDIRRRWDEPSLVAHLEFRRLVYGRANPWARLPTAESIQKIDRPDLIAFQERYLRPNNMILGVAGDFDPAAMKKLLRDTFAGWANAKVNLPQVPKIQDAVPVGVHLIDRPLPQSTIALGHLGASRFDPDRFPLTVLNYVLGEGGFDSRLVREVRSTRGLAYSVGGGVGLDSDRGLFQITCRTKSGSTVESIQVIRDILKQLREAGPTEDEVRQAKEARINSFVFSVDGTVPFMHAYLYYDYYNYPPDYLSTYRDLLSKVTRDQVALAARKHLDPDRLVVLVVGSAKGFDRPLSNLGLGDTKTVPLD